jgi:hypothetical protein
MLNTTFGRFLLISAVLASVGISKAQAAKPFNLICHNPYNGTDFSITVPSTGVEVSKNTITVCENNGVDPCGEKLVVDRVSGTWTPYFRKASVEPPYRLDVNSPYLRSSGGKCEKATSNKF